MTNIAGVIRKRIETAPGSYWRFTDFSDLSSSAAVSKSLSRMAKEGKLERVSKGVYYFPRLTRFGRSRPSKTELQKFLADYNLKPVGITAANLLGFSTQNTPGGEFATSSNCAPRRFMEPSTKLHTRRPRKWDSLSAVDAALLDFLRTRGKWSELSQDETKKRLLEYFQESDRFYRVASIALDEPPRVRAMLGAIGVELKKNRTTLNKLKDSLNPLSRFDFGFLNNLRYASEWQAQ